MEFAASALQNDRAIVLAAIAPDMAQPNGQPLGPLNSRVRMPVSTSTRGLMLRCASLTLRGDKQVVLLAVKRCGASLQFAAASLRDDAEVIAQGHGHVMGL